MKNFKIAIAAILVAGLYLAGCKVKSQNSSPEEVQNKHLQLDSVQKIVTRTRQNYKAMDNHTLLLKLSDQSKRKKEPFNSLAFRELKTRKDVNPDSLVALVHGLKGSDALLPLLLLRTLNNQAYTAIPVELRTNILTDALMQSKTFNMWGLPGPYLEDASKALLECGRSAIPALRRMLTETRPTPLYGSKEYMIATRYQLRLCDYALFFIEKIQGNTAFILPVAVAERDKLIKGL